MSTLIASGTTAATSADFTLADGQSTTLFLTDATGPDVANQAVALIQIKSAGGQYFTIGRLTHDNPVQVLAAPGTYRVKRDVAPVAFAVEQA